MASRSKRSSVRSRVFRVSRRVWSAIVTGDRRSESCDSCEGSCLSRVDDGVGNARSDRSEDRRPTPPLRVALLAILLTAGVGVGGCDKEPGDGPPVVRFGQDVCAHCNMIVTDPRSVAASVVLRDGRRQVLVFDDLLDQVKHHATNPGEPVVKRYVSDYATKAWVDAAAAKYVRAEGVHTPMGSGLLAFATDAAADAAAEQHGGRRIAFEALGSAAQSERGARHRGVGEAVGATSGAGGNAVAGDGGAGATQGGLGSGVATTCHTQVGTEKKTGGCCAKKENE